MKNTALLLTQYERFGTVGKDEYIEMFIDECLKVDESIIGYYNEYLASNGYETYFTDLDEILCGLSPVEIARMTYYGDFRFAADYHKFNGYANIDSFDEYQIIREMQNNKEFLKWYIDENDLIDFDSDEFEQVIKMANDLIKAGF